ncbi:MULTISPECIES: hypothetical protein [unclassified Lentimonas]|uniref:hypothetical protein n=1 Tax=unclassified Lentimonas TaxID=2630993 RepID=UPI0013894EE8|nr:MULTISPECIES: hypothetical protein [unclassified Lentimonas]
MRTHFQQNRQTPAGYRYQAISAALAMLVLLLSFASASPTLHSWLHADAGCEHHHDDHDHAPEHSKSSEESGDHYCAVTLLHSGATLSIPVELPQLGDSLLAVLSIHQESIRYEHPSLPYSARGPPTLIVV